MYCHQLAVCFRQVVKCVWQDLPPASPFVSVDSEAPAIRRLRLTYRRLAAGRIAQRDNEKKN